MKLSRSNAACFLLNEEHIYKKEDTKEDGDYISDFYIIATNVAEITSEEKHLFKLTDS